MTRKSRQPRRTAKESLDRILDLEVSRGFKDAAVVGGLDLFLAANRHELSSLALPESYASLTIQKREEWIRSVRGYGPTSPRIVQSETPIKHTGDSPVSKSKRSTKSRTNPRSPGPVTLESSLEDLPFIAKAHYARFKRLGVEDLGSLIRMYPNRHLDYSNIGKVIDLVCGEEMSVVVTITSSTSANIGGRRGAAKVIGRDDTGFVNVTWFGQPYLAQQLRPGTRIVVSGKVEKYREQLQFQNPEYEIVQGDNLTHAGNLLPIYPSTEGMYQRTLRTAARNALDLGIPLLSEYLDSDLKARNVLLDLQNAVQSMHYPNSMEEWFAARRRLAFDELFVNQLGVQRRKREWRERADGVSITPAYEVLESFLRTLEFKLTQDQDSALYTVLSDISSEVPMGRLLQGEVGSGKTIIAVTALLGAVSCGYQGALLAPTEVLAEQHYLSLQAMFNAVTVSEDQTEMFDPIVDSDAPRHGGDPVVEAKIPGIDSPVRIALLIGSHTQRVKRGLQAQIATGEIDLIVGTHAVIQESVQFEALGLAVVDEQHRFGVEQRAVLGDQHPRPHLLGMSATPIPRTLALTLYGDLDLTTLRQLPGGRKPITTSWARSSDQRRAAYELVINEVDAGRQAFVVCPLINESEEILSRSAMEEFDYLSNGPFNSLRVGLLHGRLPLPEKQHVMDRFRNKEIDVLVATPVIEVGIDIPNASVMLVEGAERFGLSQLHQLRGRIGRGGHASHCVLLSDKPSPDAQERLGIIERTSDGFDLAEEDLRLRGPGDYIGTRQSGFADLLIATLSDVDLLASARAEAIDLIADDPGLTDPGHEKLGKELDRVLKDRVAEFS